MAREWLRIVIHQILCPQFGSFPRDINQIAQQIFLGHQDSPKDLSGRAPGVVIESSHQRAVILRQKGQLDEPSWCPAG